MLPSLLGFNGVVSKTNQDANNLEGGSWDGVDRHRAFIGGQTPPPTCASFILDKVSSLCTMSGELGSLLALGPAP